MIQAPPIAPQQNFLKTLKELSLFSLPIILGQLGQMLISAGDVWMAARYSTETVAAIGIAQGIINPLLIVGLGALMGVAPYLSNKRGRGENITPYLTKTLLFSLILSAFFSVLTILAIPLFYQLELTPSVVPEVVAYTEIVVWSFTGAYLYQALKEYLQAQEDIFMANFISLLAIIINLILNYYLIFGRGPFPPMGIKGLAYASLIVRWGQGLFLFVYVALKLWRQNHRSLRKTFYSLKLNKLTNDRNYLQKISLIGLPIALTILVEVAAFCSVSLILGRISSLQAAAHNIILTLASITFMVPLAIAGGVAVKVGMAHGEDNHTRVKLLALSSIVLSLGFMTLSGLSFLFLPHLWLQAFTTDQELLQLCTKLLIVVAAFQIVDGLQVTMAGILRGLGVVKITLIIAFIGHWLIGIPLGTYLAYQTSLKAMGSWIGLALALLFVSLALIIPLKKALLTRTDP